MRLIKVKTDTGEDMVVNCGALESLHSAPPNGTIARTQLFFISGKGLLAAEALDAILAKINSAKPASSEER